MSPLVCKIMGAIFVVVAIWGFVDGSHVLIFHVNTMHNLVHLASGVLALICGFASLKAARTFSIAFGIVYGLVAILGFMNVQIVNDLLHLNEADNFLHIGIALLFLGAAFLPMPHPRTATT